MAHLEEAERAGRAVGDAVLAAYARCDRGIIRCYCGDARRALDEMVEGVAMIDALPPDHAPAGVDVSAWIAETADVGGAHAARERRGILATWSAIAGDYRRARASAEAVIDEVGEGSPQILAFPWMALAAVAAAMGQPAMAATTFDRALDAVREAGDWALAGSVACEQLEAVCLAYRTADVDERDRLAAIGEDAQHRASGGTYEDLSAGARLPLLLLEGRWGEALSVAQRLARVPGLHRRTSLLALGTLHRHQGRRGDAWVCINTALPRRLASEPGDYPLGEALDLFRLAADLALDAGDLETAAAWLDAHTRWLEWSGAVRRRADGLTSWARYHVAAGDYARAAELADEAVAQARSPQQPLALIAALRTAGEIALDAGHPATAGASLKEAATLADACRAPFELALAELAGAEVLVAEHRPDEARTMLERCRDALVSMGARPALTRAESLLAQLAATQPPAAPGGLSRREVDVLRLLAAGKSNKQLGHELSISVRTAERHVGNLYVKIGATSRAEAIAFAHRHDLL